MPGLVAVETCAVAALFDGIGMANIGGDFYCRPGTPAARLFDAVLFAQSPAGARQQAHAVTCGIIARLRGLQTVLDYPERGKMPLNLRTD